MLTKAPRCGINLYLKYLTMALVNGQGYSSKPQKILKFQIHACLRQGVPVAGSCF